MDKHCFKPKWEGTIVNVPKCLSSKSDAESLFKEEKEKEKEDHILSHSSEEGGVYHIGRRKVKLGQISDTIATRIAETSALVDARTDWQGKVFLLDHILQITPKSLIISYCSLLGAITNPTAATEANPQYVKNIFQKKLHSNIKLGQLQNLTEAFEFNYPHRRKSNIDDV
ncbi:hypothetical protein RFI_26259, partial [Reticulomyxa filosa]